MVLPYESVYDPSDPNYPVQDGKVVPVKIVTVPASQVKSGYAVPVIIVGGTLSDIQSTLDAIATDVDGLIVSMAGVVSTTNEIEDHAEILLHHNHNFEVWYGLLAVPAGGKVAQENLTPFRVTTGTGAANTFGAAVLVLDTNDTPVASGAAFYDLHRIFIFNVQTARIFKMRLLYSYNPRTGATYATAADALAARNYSDLVFKVDATNNDGVPVNIIGARVPSGTKVWVQAASDSGTATWIDFQIGLHEYGA